MPLQPAVAVSAQAVNQTAVRTSAENKLNAERHEASHMKSPLCIQRGKYLGRSCGMRIIHEFVSSYLLFSYA